MSSKQEKKLRKAYRKSVDEINVELANRNIAKLHATVRDLTLRNNALSLKLDSADKKYKSLDKKYKSFLIFGMLSYGISLILIYLGV